MAKRVDDEFAGSAVAEAPLVIAYLAGLICFALAWTNFSLPPVGITELSSIAAADNVRNAEKYRALDNP